MSHLTSPPKKILAPLEKPLATEPPCQLPTNEISMIKEVLGAVETKIAPVWPLKDYVAVNPYAGLASQKFLSVRNFLQSVSDLELLMSVDYYRQQFAEGQFIKEDIDSAIDEMVADKVEGAERIDVNQVVAHLQMPSSQGPSADDEFVKSINPARKLRTYAEALDKYAGSHWCRLICDEVSKHCANYYDEGQAPWASSRQEFSLFEAWRSAARYDRRFEILGVADFRELVSQLPLQPQEALVELLDQLGVPSSLWVDYLLCEALTMPGWSAWTKHQHLQAERRGEESTDLAGLLVMRLAYEVALAKQCNFQVDWSRTAKDHASITQELNQPSEEDLLRYALLKACEIAFRNRLVTDLTNLPGEFSLHQTTNRRLAQMVFCIDVRSERIRRHLEANSSEIETFGFAGFFGLPIEFVELGETTGSSQVPVLISPKFKVYEELDVTDSVTNHTARERRGTTRFLRKLWKDFQTSAVSMFTFVETTGLLYGFKLLANSIGLSKSLSSRFDGVTSVNQERLAPSFRALNQQGICTSMQADLAESILRGIGIQDDFARIVVFCGHGSHTENNPLKAGLDCGACGGHSGEPNARLAAKLLNLQYIRQMLAERGIEIPEDTRFVAALHNTTTDELQFFDTLDLPQTHIEDLNKLEKLSQRASNETRKERLSVLPGYDVKDLMRRSRDWSEVRPEWGLAGNAAFIAAPRELTKGVSLNARSFLHSYDQRSDSDFAVLEQIMTAPLVVANWINLQYYASTVDPVHFGSGNKTVHNVVGRFGIVSGNGGDLMTGLPWQSIHDGDRYQHHPLRLLAVIAAPREAIEAILAKHEHVSSLLANGWMQLLAVEAGDFYRYTEQQQWEELASSPIPLAIC